eukprot:GHVU01230209.1.p1 GENE.GHVU01230209.1~~GHVU01230209.1.p1  ORF type:complete len:440 (-),score=44.58 GHVU01230209.1:307-1626(-)
MPAVTPSPTSSSVSPRGVNVPYKPRVRPHRVGPITAAMSAVNEGGKPAADAAADAGVPLGTLYFHLRSAKRHGGSPRRFHPKAVFTAQEEEELALNLQRLADMMRPLRAEDIRKVAYRFARQRRLKHKYNRKTKQLGRVWFYGFMRRRPELSVRKPQPTSRGRAWGFNKEAVFHFYDLVDKVVKQYNLEDYSIWNADETGLNVVPEIKRQRFVGRKGVKQFGMLTPGERGRNVTCVCACSASDSYIPPYFIFPSKTVDPTWYEHSGPPGCRGMGSKSGWQTATTFRKWLKYFVSVVKCDTSKKVLLLIDGHKSHEVLDCVEEATAMGVEMVSFPPHTTHRLQPLDVAVFGPFKQAFEAALLKELQSSTKDKLTWKDIPRLARQPYLQAATPLNAVNGFRRPGVFPTNRNAFAGERQSCSHTYPCTHSPPLPFTHIPFIR